MTVTAPHPFTTRHTPQGTFGMSASTHWLATATSQAVLERGGNAFDAPVAGRSCCTWWNPTSTDPAVT